MLLNKYHRALILSIALCLVSCSAVRNQTCQTWNREETKALAEDVERLEEELLSIRTEISRLGLETVRMTDLSESGTVETVTEIFDTDKPADSETGVPPLLSRTTERREKRLQHTAGEHMRLESSEMDERRDSLQAALELQSLTAASGAIASEGSVRDETKMEKKGLSWGQHTLVYIGLAALLYGIARLLLLFFKPYLTGILSTIKQRLKSF